MKGHIFCPKTCPHYSKATKYKRKCYYEVQCWRGRLDLLIFRMLGRFRR
jgi:hypothetical protein